MSVPEYTFHPVAELFPRMSDEEFAKLKADVAANGLRQPIIIWQEQIIDGRHRYAALKQLGKWSNFYEQELDDDADPIAYAISANLHRRHLNESQRAMVAAELANLREGRPGKETALIQAVSQEQAASMLGVSRSCVQAAAKTKKKAAPELANAVKEGKVSVAAAAAVVEDVPDKDEQAAIVAKGAKAVQQAAKQARQKKLVRRDKIRITTRFDQVTNRDKRLLAEKIWSALQVHSFKLNDHVECLRELRRNKAWQYYDLPDWQSFCEKYLLCYRQALQTVITELQSDQLQPVENAPQLNNGDFDKEKPQDQHSDQIDDELDDEVDNEINNQSQYDEHHDDEQDDS